jgi:hypothetical protein
MVASDSLLITPAEEKGDRGEMDGSSLKHFSLKYRIPLFQEHHFSFANKEVRILYCQSGPNFCR